MPTRQDDFRQRLGAILRDLQTDGKNDPEAMWLLGSLAAALVDKVGARSWKQFKDSMTRARYDQLLADFQEQGNTLYQQGKGRHAYAVQTLAVSLIASTQADPMVRDGEAMLDEAVAHALAYYRRSAPKVT